jgi:hypothetical protein
MRTLLTLAAAFTVLGLPLIALVHLASHLYGGP